MSVRAAEAILDRGALFLLLNHWVKYLGISIHYLKAICYAPKSLFFIQITSTKFQIQVPKDQPSKVLHSQG